MNPNATITDEQFKQYLKEVREMVEGPYTEWQKEIEVTNTFPEKFYQSNIEHNIYRFSLPVEYGGWGLNPSGTGRVLSWSFGYAYAYALCI